mmetsp:Transcript_2801/g.3298  ORF Transcript_2801/g.3298 Transcript_2801/m.3298 type:complete len:241 (-) Transcript_2801:19-741(-)
MKPQIYKELLIFSNLSLSIVLSGLVVSKLKNIQPTRKEDHEEEDDETPDFHTMLVTRRTVSKFEPTLPEGWESVIRQGIEAAISAPNHKRTEPWRFCLLSPDTAKKVCELNAALVAEGKGGTKAGEAKLKKWLEVPGWIVITCVKDNVDEKIAMEDPKSRSREDYAAVCCAVQNFCLSLHANGYGTKWSTGNVNFQDKFNEIVNIPTTEYVVGTIWFGKTAKKPSPKQMKLSVDDVLRRS